MMKKEILRESEYVCLYRVFLGLTPSRKRRRFEYYIIDYIDKRGTNACPLDLGCHRLHAIIHFNFINEYYENGIEHVEKYLKVSQKK